MNSTTEPNFICIGPGRCGTTWLQLLLESHPQVQLAKIKETEFFNNNYKKGLGWYRNLFPYKDSRISAIGEISNMYYCDDKALRRIASDLPNVKIIMGYREPKSLYLSYLTFSSRRGLSLENIVDRRNIPLGRIMGSGYYTRKRKKLNSDGDEVPLIEAVNLKRWRKLVYSLFPAENIYMYNYKQVSNDSESLAHSILEFIGADPKLLNYNTQKRINEGTTARYKFLGRLAASVAYILRVFQLYKTLNLLKNNDAIKSLILTKNKGARLELSTVEEQALQNLEL